MKIPKTTKSYLKMLLEICEHNANIKHSTLKERTMIRLIIAHIQNEMGDTDFEEIMKKYNLKWNG